MRRLIPPRPSGVTTDRTVWSAADSAAHVGRARVGWVFIGQYMLADTGTSLLFLAPLLVSLALKVNDLVGIDEAPSRLPTTSHTPPGGSHPFERLACCQRLARYT